MLLAEIVKGIILENKASPFLKFYYDLRVGRDPDKGTLFDCLTTLKEYYEDYLRWYKKHRKPHEKQEEWKVIRDFATRLKEINSALASDDIKKQIIAVDNGINQWHIDYPVVYHMWMHADREGIAGGLESSEEQVDWEEVQDLLTKLGKLSSESPYKYRGYEQNFPPSKRHLHAILPRRMEESFPKPQSDLYHITTTNAIKEGKLVHPSKKSLFFSRILTKDMKDWGERMVAKYGGELILVKLPYKNINKYLWREGQTAEGDFLYTFSDIDRNDIEVIKL